MSIVEGTLVRATVNNPPVEFGGVVTQAREINIQDKKVTIAKIMFQTDEKTRGVYAFYPEYSYGSNETTRAVSLISGDDSCPNTLIVIE